MWTETSTLHTYLERRRTHGQVAYDKWRALPLFHVLIAVTIVCHVQEKLIFFSSLLTTRWCNSIWWCSPGGWCVDTSFSHCHLLHRGYCRHCLCCGMPHIQLRLQEQKVCYYIKSWFIHHHHHSYVWRKLHICITVYTAFTLFSLRLIRLSSYHLNCLIGCGAVIMYMTIYSLIIPTTDPHGVVALCTVGTLLMQSIWVLY